MTGSAAAAGFLQVDMLDFETPRELCSGSSGYWYCGCVSDVLAMPSQTDQRTCNAHDSHGFIVEAAW